MFKYIPQSYLYQNIHATLPEKDSHAFSGQFGHVRLSSPLQKKNNKTKLEVNVKNVRACNKHDLHQSGTAATKTL